jgi:penicillin amidase
MGKSWADTYRADRVNEVLASKKKHSLEDMMKLQFDYLSIPARELIPMLRELKSTNTSTELARKLLLNWNFVLSASSVEAGIYVAWEKKILAQMLQLKVPVEAKSLYRSIPLSLAISWLKNPTADFGVDPVAGRNTFLINTLHGAVETLEKKLGTDKSKWQYGQLAYHHVLIKHPLSNAVNIEMRSKLDVGPLPRGGYGSTPGMTGNSDNQTSGASFRMVADTEDWDKTMFTNSPGQSGNINSPYYKNLFPLWANDEHFPVYFTKEKILQNAGEKVLLVPNP